MAHKNISQFYLECLKRDVESKVGRNIVTYSDFNYLYLELKREIPDTPSVSTLKRMWAYVADNSTRSRSTLNSLSRFLGFGDWNEYVEHLMRGNRVESGFLDARTILSNSLRSGDIVEVEWNPGRKLQVVALGDNRYEVLKSENSKLQPRTQFTTLMFSRGLPLMCVDVSQGETSMDTYVAGSKSGITALRLLPRQSDCKPDL